MKPVDKGFVPDSCNLSRRGLGRRLGFALNKQECLHLTELFSQSTETGTFRKSRKMAFTILEVGKPEDQGSSSSAVWEDLVSASNMAACMLRLRRWKKKENSLFRPLYKGAPLHQPGARSQDSFATSYISQDSCTGDQVSECVLDNTKIFKPRNGQVEINSQAADIGLMNNNKFF